MSGHKARIRTIKALLAGCPCISASAAKLDIHNEFDEVHAVRKMRRASRRRRLEVLHSARGLDTMLKTFVEHHGCISPGKGPPKSMGPYLFALRDHSIASLGNITETHRNAFQTQVVTKRNTYLHEAGAFPPTDHDVNVLLADMDTCIATVVAL